MPCLYCAQEGLEIHDRGNCIHCNVAVCVNPSGRYDHDFHGEVCLCGCGRLTCEKHLIEHMEGTHPRDDGAVCFPALWIAVGGAGIRGGAAVALEPGRFAPERWHDVTRFLNVVRPGHRGLRVLTRRLPGVAVTWAGDEGWGTQEEPKVVFAPEFFSRPVAETVVAHAADAVGAAGEAMLDRPGIPPGMAELARGLGVSPEQLRHSCDELARWRRDGVPPAPEALRPWLPPDAPPGFAAHFARVLEWVTPARRGPRPDASEAIVQDLVRAYAASGPAPVSPEWGWLPEDHRARAGDARGVSIEGQAQSAEDIREVEKPEEGRHGHDDRLTHDL